MDLSPLESMMAKLSAWRECEAAAQQDLEGAEAHLLAADVKRGEAKKALVWARCNAERTQQTIAEFIIGETSPKTDYTSVGGCDCE